MSTKIYNGLQIKKMDIIELNNYIRELRKELIPIAQEEYFKSLARLIECMVVYIQTGIQIPSDIPNYLEIKSKTSKEIVYEAESIALKIIKQNKSAETILEHKESFDFDASICVFPVPRKLLALPFIENKTIREKILSKPEISEYGYWNNVDRPEKISKRDWKTREKYWNKALTGLGIPSENGFEFKIIDSTLHVYTFVYDTKKQLGNYFSTNEKLKKEAANVILLERKFEEIKASNTKDSSIQIYNESIKYIRKHPEEIEKISKTLNIDIYTFLELN